MAARASPDRRLAGWTVAPPGDPGDVPRRSLAGGRDGVARRSLAGVNSEPAGPPSPGGAAPAGGSRGTRFGSGGGSPRRGAGLASGGAVSPRATGWSAAEGQPSAGPAGGHVPRPAPVRPARPGLPGPGRPGLPGTRLGRSPAPERSGPEGGPAPLRRASGPVPVAQALVSPSQPSSSQRPGGQGPVSRRPAAPVPASLAPAPRASQGPVSPPRGPAVSQGPGAGRDGVPRGGVTGEDVGSLSRRCRPIPSRAVVRAVDCRPACALPWERGRPDPGPPDISADAIEKPQPHVSHSPAIACQRARV